MTIKRFSKGTSIIGELFIKKSYSGKKNKTRSNIIPIEEEFNILAFTEIISAYANHNFNNKLKISNKNSITDAIATGINFLGEELENTTISRDYFSNIYNAISEILITINKDGNITDFNKAAENILGVQKETLLNTDPRNLVHSNFKQIENEIRNSFSLGENHYSFELKLKKSNGRSFPVFCTLSKIFDRFQNHQGYLFIAKDISEKKDRELKEKKIVMTTLEKERIRLSRDMHDSLGQEINAVKLYLNTISSMDSSSKEYKELIKTCKTMLNNSIETIRDICFDLMPKALEKGSFINACNELVVKLKPICKIEYNFPKFKINLNKENQTILYRIIQEFISNSIHHSKCTKIELKILKDKKKIHIFIQDNGKGFKMDKIIKGNGLYNIISRIEALQIGYNFKSELKKGTSLELNINE